MCTSLNEDGLTSRSHSGDNVCYAISNHIALAQVDTMIVRGLDKQTSLWLATGAVDSVRREGSIGMMGAEIECINLTSIGSV
jgi:hypothetical protein